MASYNYQCKKCGAKLRFLSKKERHEKCSGLLERVSDGAHSQLMDVLDNGLMQRRIERLSNVEELVHDRAQSDPRIVK